MFPLEFGGQSGLLETNPKSPTSVSIVQCHMSLVLSAKVEII